MGGEGNASEPLVVLDQSSVPTVCTSESRCECGDAPMTTFTWYVNGEQRCTTVYVPPGVPKPMPVMLVSNCYGRDKLRAFLNREEKEELARFGLAAIYLSTPTGGWEMGNDGIINDEIPQPCADKEATYVADIFKHIIEADPASYDASKVYAYGFSQNSMFSAYLGFCFSEKIAGIAQSGSGLVVPGGTSIPNKGGECKYSDYVQNGTRCLQTPCSECMYFPIYPCHTTGHSLIWCGFVYDNDYLAGTMQPMYDTLVEEGYDARLMTFEGERGRGARGGHKWMENKLDWIVGCFGLTPQCSAECEAGVVACVEAANPDTLANPDTYAECVESMESTTTCAAGCAPTKHMLETSQRPTFTLSQGAFGASPGPLESTGTCTHTPAPLWVPVPAPLPAPVPLGTSTPVPGTSTPAPLPAPEPLPAPVPLGTSTPVPGTSTPAPLPAPEPLPPLGTSTPVPGTSTPAPTSLECRSRCEAMFLRRCMPMLSRRFGARKAYNRCRRQIDLGVGPLSLHCSQGCTSTPRMAAAASD